MRAGTRTSTDSTGTCSLTVADIADRDAVRAALDGCDAIVNFAAETHVDRSIDTRASSSNGRLRDLRAARGRPRRRHPPPVVSTDEVYGSIEEGSVRRGLPARSLVPGYSASKAGGDLLVGGFGTPTRCDALIVRASNNYSPRQYPESSIPLCVLNALAGDPLPVYGDGTPVTLTALGLGLRGAIDTVLEFGQAGRSLQRRRPRRAPQHRSSGGSWQPGGRRIADRARRRPARP